MKKVTLVAGLASFGALAAVLATVPAAAATHESHDFWPAHDRDDGATTSMPEPGTLALLGLGLTGLGITRLGRNRKK